MTEESAFGYTVRFARILLTTSALFGVFYVMMQENMEKNTDKML